MRRRMITAAVTLAAIGAGGLAAAPGAMAAPGGSTCTLNGTATFSTPLSATASPFGYSFTGTLSNCQSTYSGAPSSGTIAAGTGGLPAASGSGSCASSTTSGTAVITWADGDNTVVQYTTTGATAAVALQGTVISSVNETTTTNGTTTTTTITTNEPATPVGSGAGGALAFQPPNPTGCAPGGGGVSTAGISGQIGTGNS